jgi:prepilin-type N-terminal cleavage/methylation domain-containing protein
MKKRANQKGFTLVEIAIVLVIIGLLLGALLKGQEMINSAKIKRVMKQADEIRAAAYTYQDLQRFLPGDDTAPIAGNPGNGNGQVAAGAASEQGQVFIHLAAKNLIVGSYNAANPYPTHPLGGRVSLLWAAALSGAARTTHWIQFTTVPGRDAQSIDTAYDDGVWNTGSIRANAAYTTASVTLGMEF